jgi:hypothetical protein
LSVKIAETPDSPGLVERINGGTGHNRFRECYDSRAGELHDR